MSSLYKIIIRLSIVIFFSFTFLFLSAERLSLKDLFKQAHSLYQDGECVQAVEIANEITKINPQFYPAYNLIGLCKTKEKRNVLDAVFYFEQSLDVNSKQPQIYNIISVLYKELGMDDKSFSYIKEGLQYNPNSFVLNYNAGLTALLVKHNPEDAVDYFKKSQKIEPTHQRLLYLLGVAYLFSNQKEMTLDTITRLRGIKSQDLAKRLEVLIRKTEKGEDINFSQILDIYDKQPSKEKTDQKQGNNQGKVKTSPAQATLEGKGTIYIKQKYQKTD